MLPKKTIGIVFCLLMIIPVLSISCKANDMNDPLTIRAEVNTINDNPRLFSLRVYATNTWDQQIIVHFRKPCLLGVFYLLPNTEKEFLVYEPYKANIYQFIRTTTKFEPGEEKIIQRAVFYGLSNWILPGFARGYQSYIPSFPKLPDGEYRFSAILNPYQIGDEYKQYIGYTYTDTLFHFGAS